MLRIFIAIPIPQDICAQLLHLQNGIENARYSPPENFHITLRFIGDMNEADIEILDKNLGEIDFNSFDISLNGVGFFGGDKPHSIHALTNNPPPIFALAAKCEAICLNLGLEKEHKKYTPHLTLAYLPKNVDLIEVINFQAKHNLFKSKKWRANCFNLYASHMGKGPSHYEILAQYPLK